jgi:nicotinamidase-related amidase
LPGKQDESILTRSPQLMTPAETVLLVIDVQERLWPYIHGRDAILPRIDLLVQAAGILGIRTIATEQYTKGLGPTIEPIAGRLPDRIEKLAFSAAREPRVLAELEKPGVRKVLLAGIETHVCVQQTALDLLAAGFQVYLPVDAVGSRSPLDKETALTRLSSSGVTLTTAESAVFEWTEISGTPVFKRISELIKQYPPGSGKQP